MAGMHDVSMLRRASACTAMHCAWHTCHQRDSIIDGDRCKALLMCAGEAVSLSVLSIEYAKLVGCIIAPAEASWLLEMMTIVLLERCALSHRARTAPCWAAAHSGANLGFVAEVRMSRLSQAASTLPRKAANPNFTADSHPQLLQ